MFQSSIEFFEDVSNNGEAQQSWGEYVAMLACGMFSRSRPKMGNAAKTSAQDGRGSFCHLARGSWVPGDSTIP